MRITLEKNVVLFLYVHRTNVSVEVYVFKGKFGGSVKGIHKFIVLCPSWEEEYCVQFLDQKGSSNEARILARDGNIMGRHVRVEGTVQVGRTVRLIDTDSTYT